MDDVEADYLLKSSAVGIRNRMRQALERAGVTQAEIARRAQEICPRCVKQLLSNAATRGAKPRDPQVQRAFAEALGVDAGWLWSGRRPPSMMRPITEQEAQEDRERDAEIEAKGERRRNARQEGRSVLQGLGLPVRPDPNAYVVPVSSAAWEPLVRAGDCLLVTPSYPPLAGVLVYVRTPVASGLFRLVSVGNEGVVLITPQGMPVTVEAGAEVHRVGGVVFGQ